MGPGANQQVQNQIERRYDAWGHVTAEFQAVAGAVDHNATPGAATTPHVQYLYGSDGLRLRQMVYPDGRCVWYGYDNDLDEALARPTWIGDAASGGDQVLESYQYLGLATALTRSRPLNDSAATLVVQTTTLDAFGRASGLAWATSAGVLQSLGYAYDHNSNWKYRADGELPGYNESSRINRRNQRDRFTRGPLGEDPIQTQEWRYNGKGNLERSTVTKDVLDRPVLAGAYSDMSQLGQKLDAWKAANSADRPLGAMAVRFDAWGNLTQLQEFDVKLQDGHLRPFKTRDLDFDYDALNRRVKELEDSIDAVAVRRLYVDLDGRVLQEGEGKTQYVWSPVTGNLILRDRDTDADTRGLEERIYALDDGQGNVSAIADRNGQILQRYFYTPEGELTITDEDGHTTHNGQTWKAPSYDWRYLFRTGRRDADGTYRIGIQEWNSLQAACSAPTA